MVAQYASVGLVRGAGGQCAAPVDLRPRVPDNDDLSSPPVRILCLECAGSTTSTFRDRRAVVGDRLGHSREGRRAEGPRQRGMLQSRADFSACASVPLRPRSGISTSLAFPAIDLRVRESLRDQQRAEPNQAPSVAASHHGQPRTMQPGDLKFHHQNA